MVQTGQAEEEIQWHGNQRVLHYGPMAQRDPFFYYYPKGWDILYPAHFGFFPYRTSKFRGSSPTVCMTAFGGFFSLSGAVMFYLAYFKLYEKAPWQHKNLHIHDIPPLQIIGPIFLLIGVIFLVFGVLNWCCSLQLCSERLRHTQPHHKPPRRTITQHVPEPVYLRGNVAENSPYQPPPPPPYPVLVNEYTETSMYNPESEMKLYPPVMPGYSTLSLPHSYVGSPYNTLSSPPKQVPHTASPVIENTPELQWPGGPEYHVAKMARRTESSKRDKY